MNFYNVALHSDSASDWLLTHNLKFYQRNTFVSFELREGGIEMILYHVPREVMKEVRRRDHRYFMSLRNISNLSKLQKFCDDLGYSVSDFAVDKTLLIGKNKIKVF